jgi:hypothetical protein
MVTLGSLAAFAQRGDDEFALLCSIIPEIPRQCWERHAVNFDGNP